MDINTLLSTGMEYANDATVKVVATLTPYAHQTTEVLKEVSASFTDLADVAKECLMDGRCPDAAMVDIYTAGSILRVGLLVGAPLVSAWVLTRAARSSAALPDKESSDFPASSAPQPHGKPTPPLESMSESPAPAQRKIQKPKFSPQAPPSSGAKVSSRGPSPAKGFTSGFAPPSAGSRLRTRTLSSESLDSKALWTSPPDSPPQTAKPSPSKSSKYNHVKSKYRDTEGAKEPRPSEMAALSPPNFKFFRTLKTPKQSISELCGEPVLRAGAPLGTLQTKQLPGGGHRAQVPSPVQPGRASASPRSSAPSSPRSSPSEPVWRVGPNTPVSRGYARTSPSPRSTSPSPNGDRQLSRRLIATSPSTKELYAVCHRTATAVDKPLGVRRAEHSESWSAPTSTRDQGTPLRRRQEYMAALSKQAGHVRNTEDPRKRVQAE